MIEKIRITGGSFFISDHKSKNEDDLPGWGLLE